MGSIGLQELLVISGIIILLFGAKRLPELGKSLGEGIRSFKLAVSGEEKEDSRKIV